MLPDFMFRTSAMKSIGGFVDFPLAWYADEATWHLLSANGVAASNKAILHFRLSSYNICGRTDLTLGKLDATIRYRRWFENFVATLKVSNETDEFFLKSIRSDAICNIEEAIVGYMKMLPFSNWIVFYRKIKAFGTIRARILKNRIRWICHFKWLRS